MSGHESVPGDLNVLFGEGYRKSVKISGKVSDDEAHQQLVSALQEYFNQPTNSSLVSTTVKFCRGAEDSKALSETVLVFSYLVAANVFLPNSLRIAREAMRNQPLPIQKADYTESGHVGKWKDVVGIVVLVFLLALLYWAPDKSAQDTHQLSSELAAMPL
jgi:hypothetical protein